MEFQASLADSKVVQASLEDSKKSSRQPWKTQKNRFSPAAKYRKTAATGPLARFVQLPGASGVNPRVPPWADHEPEGSRVHPWGQHMNWRVSGSTPGANT